MRKRGLCLVAILVVVVLTVSPMLSAKEPLRIMWWGSQTRHDRTLQVIDLFTEKTGIEVEPEFYGFDDYISKLNILIAANDAPDLMQMGGNFPTYIDHIQPINPYIESGIIDISNTDESFIGITTLKVLRWGFLQELMHQHWLMTLLYLRRLECLSRTLIGPGMI